MTSNVSRFMEASRSDSDLAQKVNAIGAEATALVATRLSELSQGTAFPFKPGEMLAAHPVVDDELGAVTGGSMLDSVRAAQRKYEVTFGPFTFTFYDNPALNMV
ncbi:hypothetical protein [Aquabacter sediminis]|uniref:hypothetical protein n=1 Tax=Aquabacter sediminis TaxID=3029197 RepID=UPI00237EA4B2|nr:hypothetical protein [Aquabacter sp. P-9]MDE1569812.1 hypothetical protein [Aquabacter sp. P-9]